MTTLRAHAVPADVLDRVRRSGRDLLGHRPVPWPRAAGMPLRCCLRPATADDDVVLISHAPSSIPSPWREVGPVFVHREPCGGYPAGGGLPPTLDRGPRVLRGYRADGSLDHDAVVVVGDDRHLADDLLRLLDREGVVEVHVRAVGAQCFTYLVRADGGPTGRG